MAESLAAKQQPKKRAPADELDQLARTTRPGGWVALVLTAVTIALVLVWACAARIPELVQIPGVVTVAEPRVSVLATSSGTVVKIAAVPGQVLQHGQTILELKQADGAVSVVVAPKTGVLHQVVPRLGSRVANEDVVATLAPFIDDQELYSISYVSQSQASEYAVGSDVTVELRDGHGAMQGKVLTISHAPATIDEMAEVLGSQSAATDAYAAAGGAPITVTVGLGAHPHWLGAPPPYQLAPGQQVDVVRVTAEPHPIEWLLP